MRIFKRVIPDATIVKLRYVEFITLNPGVGTLAYHTFRASSVFDPNYSGGGHQPNGFDQWANFYDQYIVLGAKCTFMPYVYATGVGDSCFAACQCTIKSPITATTLDELMEQRDTPYRALISKDGKSYGKVVSYYSPRKIYGIKDVKDANQLRCGVGENPNWCAYFHVYVGGLNPADDPTVTSCRVVIDYIVQFAGVKELTGS